MYHCKTEQGHSLRMPLIHLHIQCQGWAPFPYRVKSFFLFICTHLDFPKEAVRILLNW
uniref:Uncharacterized protein n=1 Tax=Anguilla anguilla TaxID=7936 RepID=A0A0E9X0B3_ANGAN